MADQRVSVRDRVRAIDHLEALAFQLNRASSWAADQDCETEADMLESAARSVLAACHLLGRPLRRDPPPERWQAGRVSLGRFCPALG
jgi:hypothetical protein